MSLQKWRVTRGITFKFVTVSMTTIILAAIAILIIALPRLTAIREQVMLGAAVFLLITVLVITVAFHRIVISPMETVMSEMAFIAEGNGGGFPRRLSIDSGDEFGQLAGCFNGIIEEMHESVVSVAATLDELSAVSASVKRAALTVQGTVLNQCGSIDDISSSIGELNRSITNIAGDAKELLHSTDATSSSTLEISTSIREVAHTTDALDATADTIHSAVNQIANSLKQVTANLVLLAELTSSASSSAARVNGAIKDITAHAQDQAGIARDVKEAADTAGLEAVNSTKQGMEKIRQEVFTTNDAIESLSSKSDQIGKIVGVIGNVAEETNLLALNAAILAAQSGENGKAFGVIAEKIRGLAKRSAESTKDIGEIINQVQQDIDMAGKAVKRSISEVDSGVHLSSEAEKVLKDIIIKAETSLDMALQVGSSVVEQSKSVELNASAIQNFKKMSEDIKKAVTRQSQAAEEIVRGVKELRECTGFVKQSLAEQSRESENIAEVVQSLFSRAQIIAQGTKEQCKVAEDIVVSIIAVKQKADQTLSASDDLDAVTEGLNRQTSIVHDRLEQFKTG
ncbi:MAG: methyl-accepting chemotaxis sensory [Geobacteraceae bacterium]|nr:MAG: methyl-accepting chemotaxis sensory [Geobacteraceae bacterium]